MNGKLLFIVNPVAGRRRFDRYYRGIDEIFKENGWEVAAYLTEKSGDARDMAAVLAPDFDRVVCMGGDGTLSETVNGLSAVDFCRPLGYIPAGSTNDFAMSLSLPPDVLSAADVASSGRERRVDVMKLGERLSINTANLGVFTDVAYETPQNMKNALGLAAYVLSGIRDLSRLKAEPIRFTAGERVVEGDFFFTALCNSTALGDSFSHSAPDDGMLDALLLRKPKTLGQLQRTVTHLVGGVYDDECLEVLHTDCLTVETAAPCTWTVDGERYDGGVCTEASMLHQCLRLIVPADENKKNVPTARRKGRWMAFDLGLGRNRGLAEAPVAADDLAGDETGLFPGKKDD